MAAEGLADAGSASEFTRGIWTGHRDRTCGGEREDRDDFHFVFGSTSGSSKRIPRHHSSPKRWTDSYASCRRHRLETNGRYPFAPRHSTTPCGRKVGVVRAKDPSRLCQNTLAIVSLRRPADRLDQAIRRAFLFSLRGWFTEILSNFDGPAKRPRSRYAPTCFLGILAWTCMRKWTFCRPVEFRGWR